MANADGSTWDRLAVPLLQAVRQLEVEADGAYVHTSASALAEQAGVTDPRVRQEVDRLIEGGYIVVAHRAGGLRPEDDLMGVSLGVAGARAVGDWHSEVAYDVLIERLAAAAEDPELSDEQRSKVRAMLSAAGGAAREVVVKVIGELAARGVMG